MSIVLLVVCFLIYNKKNIIKNDYNKYYSEIVKVNKDAKIYIKKNDEYIEKGKIYKNTLIKLQKIKKQENIFYKIKGFSNDYYIKKTDFNKSNMYYKINQRYKNYILFNKNIITKKNAVFYMNNKKMYSFNSTFSLPIIMEEFGKYYVEYNNMMMYILKNDVQEIIIQNNSENKNTDGIPVLNYHFVYNLNEEKCNQEICHTEQQFRSHLSYIKENNIFTPTIDEFNKYLDNKIQLPKSVLITIDDGRNINLATKIIEEYKLNATAFIVTSRYDFSKDFIKSQYVEWQSHSHALHDVGTCPYGHGQGGGLTCLSDKEILQDLITSKLVLGNKTIAFCYPFYEYNEHSIELLKKTGYELAFAGEYANGKTKAEIGMDKYQIPRWVIVNYTTMELFKKYVNGDL